jgi:hypothetical protein
LWPPCRKKLRSRKWHCLLRQRGGWCLDLVRRWALRAPHCAPYIFNADASVQAVVAQVRPCVGGIVVTVLADACATAALFVQTRCFFLACSCIIQYLLLLELSSSHAMVLAEQSWTWHVGSLVLDFDILFCPVPAHCCMHCYMENRGWVGEVNHQVRHP